MLSIATSPANARSVRTVPLSDAIAHHDIKLTAARSVGTARAIELVVYAKSSVRLEIAAGTYFRYAGGDAGRAPQNLVVAETFRRVMEGGKTATFRVKTACANARRRVPGMHERYTLGQAPKSLKSLFSCLARAKLANNEGGGFDSLQAAIWAVTSNGLLAVRQRLSALRQRFCKQDKDSHLCTLYRQTLRARLRGQPCLAVAAGTQHAKGKIEAPTLKTQQPSLETRPSPSAPAINGEAGRHYAAGLKLLADSKLDAALKAFITAVGIYGAPRIHRSIAEVFARKRRYSEALDAVANYREALPPARRGLADQLETAVMAERARYRHARRRTSK